MAPCALDGFERIVDERAVRCQQANNAAFPHDPLQPIKAVQIVREISVRPADERGALSKQHIPCHNGRIGGNKEAHMVA